MSDMPLVSIIITTYKRHEYLHRAIKSVLSQTYQNIELLVVDDNHPEEEYSDQVKQIVDSYYKEDQRIKYITMGKNSGACAARNFGFENSKGDYINFLDDDDEFMPKKIELQVEKFKHIDDRVGSVGCFAVIKNEKGNIIQRDHNEIKGDVFFTNLCHSLCQTSLPLFKRDVFEKSGGFETIISSQEHLMLARVFDVCPYYDYVAEELVTIYHHTGERISNSKRKPFGAIELSERFKRYYEKLSESQIRELELAMNANIINAYVLIDDRKTAMSYFKKRCAISKKLSKDEMKLLFGVLFGYRAKAKLHQVKNILLGR